MSTLKGAHVVVVGGSTGIGREVVRQAVDAGARVTVGSRSADKLAAVAADHGSAVATGTVDVTDEARVESFFSAVGEIDHLVVCPGAMANGAIADVPLDQVHACLNSKLIGPLLTVRHAGRKLAKNGSVTLFSGGAGFKPAPGLAVTAAANAGVAALGKSMALEYAPVRVNVVVPGLIDTPLWADLPDDVRDGLFSQTASSLPTGRIGQPADIAAAVLHLTGNTYMTGSVMFVDGGFLL